jgi:fructose-1,6-bisphosphatase I
MAQSLKSWLEDHRSSGAISGPLASTLDMMAQACAEISRIVQLGAIAGSLGAAGQVNVQDEEQKKLDVITNDLLLDRFGATPVVAGMASEEMETFVASTATPDADACLILFDPLDGSSNIDVNVSVGTIFSVLPSPAAGRALTEADFLQPGVNQIAAGYVVYGPQTMLVVTVRQGVAGFTLNPETGEWLATHESVSIPRETKEFAINMSNMRHWAPPMRAYVEGCLAGKTGPRGKDFNMRWVASMVADVHRIMMRGGVFIYPWDVREPNRAGKLRLMYEANPMSLLVEQAGGLSTDCRQTIMQIAPTGLHQRVAVALGSAAEVEEILASHAAA